MQNYTLITGASGGIGYSLAKIFAQKKHNLILTARSKDKLDSLSNKLVKENNIDIVVITKDLSRLEEVEELVHEIEAKKLNVDILINNAGFADYGFFMERDWKKEKDMLNLNILALTYLTKFFGKKMIENKSGRILNISSVAAFQPGAYLAVYSASKAYVRNFSEALASEIKGQGVSITVLCPGQTISGFQEKAEMYESRIMKLFKFATSESVARYGYNALMKRKRIAIPGFFNKLHYFLTALIPRRILITIVKSISAKK